MKLKSKFALTIAICGLILAATVLLNEISRENMRSLAAGEHDVLSHFNTHFRQVNQIVSDFLSKQFESNLDNTKYSDKKNLFSALI